MDFLDPKNCNKKHCNSCMFNPDKSKRIKLSTERLNEINTYLMTFKSSHVCHTTNKTCYGGLEVQAHTMYIMKFIAEDTVECLLETAQKYLKT